MHSTDHPSRSHRATVGAFCNFLALGVLAVVALAGCRGGEDDEQGEVRPVRVLTLDKSVRGDVFQLVGNVQAQREVNLSFRIGGRLAERLVEVGDVVRPGQLVARLETQDEESGMQSARAQLNAARALQIEASNNFVRMRDLVEQNAVSRALFDQAQANRRAAESQVESAQAQLNLAQNRLEYTRLVSDVGGVVTAQGAEPGEVVSAGRMIAQVAGEGARDAVFDVPARIKDNAARDATVEVLLTADPNVRTSGRVREVSPRADAVTGTFRVRVALADPPAAMRLGTTVTGRLPLSATVGIAVPTTAVMRSGREPAVWVVDPKAKTVSMRAIRIQSSDPYEVVVASGLKAGDTVVTAGVQALRPGQKVRPLEAAR